MKISKSKQELASIISENGGWRDGYGFSVQDGDDCAVWFYDNAPVRSSGAWRVTSGSGLGHCGIEDVAKLPNWHQTIPSRDEYFHLYPAPDADGWIEWKGGECPVDHGVMIDVRYRDGVVRKCMPALEPVADYHDVMHQYWQNDGVDGDIIAYRLHKPEQSKPEFCESVMRSIPEPIAKPTIEQLAADYRNASDYADRKQQEADDARADAEAKLAELVAAGEALGLVVSVAGAEPELVINDWRDLRVGDEVECVDYDTEHRFGVVRSIDKRAASQWVEVLHPNMDVSWPSNWCFIRRP